MSTEETQNTTLVDGESSSEVYKPKSSLWPDLGLAAHLAVIAVLGAIIMVAFANTLHPTGFALDNKFIILEDPRLRDNKSDSIKQIFQQDYWWPKAVSGLYRPLTTFSYMVNYTVFGNKDVATGYHWMNLLIHWANAVLVYFAILVLMEKQWPAVFGAILFAVHPIVTESVTNMVGRADLLATFTVLLGFVLYTKSSVSEEDREIKWPVVFAVTLGMILLMAFCVVRRLHPGWLSPRMQEPIWVVGAIVGTAVFATLICAMTAGPRSAFWLCLMMLVTAVGVFCKESAVVVIGVLMLYDFTYRLRKKGANWFSSLIHNFWDFAWKGYIALIPPVFALWYVRSWVFDQLRPPELPFVDNPLIGTDFWTARITAIKVIGKYFWLLIWPQTLSCDYSFNQIPFVQWSFSSWEDIKALIALATIIILLVIAVRSYFRNKAVFFFVLFFFGTMLPTSNCFPKLGEPLFQKESWCIGSIMAERFMYMPSIGFAACLVIAVYAICRRIIPELDISAWATRIWLQIVARCTLALIALGFGVRTFLRNYDWEDDVVLWTQAAQACPDSFKTHKSLAYALYEKDPEFKNIDRIIEEGERALQITDKTQIVFLHLGAYYRIKGDLLATKTADGTLIPTPASLPWYQKSAATLARAVPLDREFNEDNRAKEIKRGRKPDEISDIGNHEIYWNLGLSYMRLGNYAEALKAYQYMRHLSPTNPDSYLSIASVYITTGKNEDAAITLLQALLLDSNRSEALRLLVEIYRQIDRDGNAVIMLQGRPTPQLNADSPLVKMHICRAYAGLTQIFIETKQFALAQQTQKNAVDNYKCSPDSTPAAASPPATPSTPAPTNAALK
jgi:tetratricopeptide (TPR) repeat protein